MVLDYDQDDVAFWEEVRDWLQTNAPRERRPEAGPEMRAFLLAWQPRQYDGGWAGLAWPKEPGEQGLSLIWHEEYAAAKAPPIGCLFVAMNHGGPTLIAWGTDAQKAFHLPKILKGESVWCQGFSEPGAGSDLASISSRAVIDGDDLVVSGQKIWTSYGHVADYQELLVRTSRGEKKHDGLTWVICPMDAPGIEVRTITTISGSQHFCEIFYDNVRIPMANVVG